MAPYKGAGYNIMDLLTGEGPYDASWDDSYSGPINQNQATGEFYYGGAPQQVTPSSPPSSGPTTDRKPDVSRDDLMIKSKTYSGLPDWAMSMIRGSVEPEFGRRMGAYMGSVDRFGPEGERRIEGARKGEIRQYQRDFRRPMEGEMRSSMLNAGGQGRMGSSAFADSMAAIGERYAGAGERVHESANVRAEDRQLKHLGDTAEQHGTAMGMLGNITGLTRYGEGDTVNPALWLQALGLMGG
jgi:hypothetical protein